MCLRLILELLVGRQGAVEEKTGGYGARLFPDSPRRSTAKALDQVERARQRNALATGPGAYARQPDEATRDSPVGQSVSGLLVLGAGFRPGVPRRAHRTDTSPHSHPLQNTSAGLCRACPDTSELPLAVQLRLTPTVVSVKTHGTTAAKRTAVVALHQVGKPFPGRFIESLDRSGHPHRDGGKPRRAPGPLACPSMRE